MYRLMIAKEIYRLEEEKLGYKHNITADQYAKRAVFGIGCVKPMRKTELQNRLDDLKNR